MPDVTAVILTQLGAAGAVAIILGAYIKGLQKRLDESQERRVADAQATTAKILELVEQHNEVNAALAQAINTNTEAIRNFERLMHTVPPVRGG